MDETKTKSHIFTCLVLTWSYFAMNICYAILLVTESANTLSGVRKTVFHLYAIFVDQCFSYLQLVLNQYRSCHYKWHSDRSCMLFTPSFMLKNG